MLETIRETRLTPLCNLYLSKLEKMKIELQNQADKLVRIFALESELPRILFDLHSEIIRELNTCKKFILDTINEFGKHSA